MREISLAWSCPLVSLCDGLRRLVIHRSVENTYFSDEALSGLRWPSRLGKESSRACHRPAPKDYRFPWQCYLQLPWQTKCYCLALRFIQHWARAYQVSIPHHQSLKLVAAPQSLKCHYCYYCYYLLLRWPTGGFWISFQKRINIVAAS